MSSSSSDDFWSQASGVCTIIGLVIGNLLTGIAIWLTLLSYRQQKDSDGAKDLRSPSSSFEGPPSFLVEPALSFSSQHNEMMIKRPARRNLYGLGGRGCFVALLIITMILVGCVAALAANISRIKKLR